MRALPERGRAILTSKSNYTPVPGGPIEESKKAGVSIAIPDPTPLEMKMAVRRHRGAAEIMFGYFHWRGGR